MNELHCSARSAAHLLGVVRAHAALAVSTITLSPRLEVFEAAEAHVGQLFVARVDEHDRDDVVARGRQGQRALVARS